ncbi:GDT1 GCR1-dependent translation factor 1 [Candida maltosa Xu316]|uniref:GDT1 family protein n=1 Tax=Candida maltosa (strain Xu316) TaxID=1245528 RepID=M3IVY2_CANMX|nr:Vacuolar protein, putative [Candida maltosa Xu316]
MKFSKVLFTLSLLSTTCIAAVENLDGSVDDVAAAPPPSVIIDKSSQKLGVQALEDEDNHPAAKHAKKPLDPYKNGGAVEQEQQQEQQQSPDSWHAFVMSTSMIIVSEIGDKTFLIAALMAMRNARLIVFTSAFSSLVVMTVLSGIVGHALPTLLSRRLTQFMASILFVVFGVKLLKEGMEMSKDVGVDEEMAEVEEEIASSKLNSQLDDIEGGSSSNNSKKDVPFYVDIGNQVENLAAFVFTPVWIQVFIMTFLGEWGDRSQIATIAMAAGSDYWIVILGAIIGHGICTAGACIGGKMLAKKISMRNVTIGGAIAFFIFSIMYFYDAYYNIEG